MGEIAKALLARLARHVPEPIRLTAPHRLRAAGGALLGVLVCALIGRWAVPDPVALPWLMAPVGASAILLFATPASPLAQPWSIVGGNLVSATIGVACWAALHDPVLASCAAIALALLGMFAFRCLHPPSGAVALTAILGGPAIHNLGFAYVLHPVLLNTVTLTLVAIAYNRSSGHSYPHHAHGAAAPATVSAADSRRIRPEDLDAVLSQYNEILTVSTEDLDAIITQAEAHAYERRLGNVTCRAIMTAEPHSVSFGTALDEAWALMERHGVKALPVVDRARRVVGIVTRTDFLHHADTSRHEGLMARLRHFARQSGLSHTEKPEVVGQIMTTPARTTYDDAHIVSLVPLLTGDGLSHIPVLDNDGRLAGIITPRDLVAGLYRAGLTGPVGAA